jgi:hypothetical protein
MPFATADNWKRIAPNFAELRRTDNRMIQTFSAIFCVFCGCFFLWATQKQDNKKFQPPKN